MTQSVCIINLCRRFLPGGLFLLWLLGMPFYGADAQINRQNENWYFGEYAGVRFQGGSATVLPGSAMLAPEGVSVLSNNNGELMYYTNGFRVWGADHHILVNGDNLAGDPGSTQSALLVPYPKEDYTYLFTTDADGGPKGLRFSLIRPDTAAGLGLVFHSGKNTLLHAPVTEKLALLLHCNRMSYWVVAHEWGTNRFLAYPVTEDGLLTTPVVTSTGPVYDGVAENGVGYIKASPGGDMLALAVTGSNRVDIFTFDNLNGIPEFLISIHNVYQPYGIEFSEDQTNLYVAGLDGRIYQYNMAMLFLNGQGIQIASSGKLTGALQMAPNGVIYIAREMDPFLGSINNPNDHGASCMYVEQSLYLAGRRSKGGLPQYIPLLEFPVLPKKSICLGDTVFYDLQYLQRADSFVFYFGDRTTGIYDSTTQLPIWYLFTNLGYTPVELIYYMCGEQYALASDVCVQGAPSVRLGPDTAVCENILYMLNAFPNDVYCPTIPLEFVWNTGATTSYLSVYPPGSYSVTLSNVCGTGSDTINITGLPVPQVSLGPNQTLCHGDTTFIFPLPIPDSLVWFDGSEDPMKMITQTGNYMVTVTNEFDCSAIATVIVEFLVPPEFHWNMRDTTICIDHPMELNAGSGFDSYLWQDGSTGASFLVSDSGWYHVTVFNICGSDSDSLYVFVEDCSLRLFVPNAFTPDGDGKNDEFRAYGMYVDHFRMVIYNRWGAQVFIADHPDKGWDGWYNGSPAPEGVYVYHIVYIDATGKSHHLSGSITLVRK